MPTPAHGSPRVKRRHTVLISSEFYADDLEVLRKRSERLSGEGIEQWLRDDATPTIREHESHPESGHTHDELETALGLECPPSQTYRQTLHNSTNYDTIRLLNNRYCPGRIRHENNYTV